MKTKQVHAKISQKGLKQIADFFNQNPITTLGELLQNSRRAKATQVEITAIQTGPDVRVTVLDNGEGIHSEETLMELWESGWDDETKFNESPAGFGFFALSCLPKGVTVRSRNWEMHVEQHNFTGGGPATSKPTKTALTGTKLTFHLPNTNLDVVDRQIADAVKFYPIPVRYNKRAMEQGDFLAEADFITTIEGLRIGVFHRNSHYRERNINFHGVTLEHNVGCPHPEWHVKLDVLNASMVHLVKPTRNAVIEDQQWMDTLALCRKATYEACAVIQSHHLPFAQWQEAKKLGIDLPEAVARLKVAKPTKVHESGWDIGYAPNYPAEYSRTPDPVPTPTSTLNGLANADIVALHLSGQNIPIMFEAQANMEGYSWYPQKRATELVQKIRIGKKTFEALTEGGDVWDKIYPLIRNRTLADKITLEMVVIGEHREKNTVEIETGIAFNAEDSGDDAVGNWISTEAGLKQVSSSTLEALFFYLSDGAESDSYDTQHDYFEEEAEKEIIRRTHGEEAEHLHTIRNTVCVWEVRNAMKTLGVKSVTITLDKDGQLNLTLPKANPAKKTK